MVLHILFTCNFQLPILINFITEAYFFVSFIAIDSKYRAYRSKTYVKDPEIGCTFYIRDNGHRLLWLSRLRDLLWKICAYIENLSCLVHDWEHQLFCLVNLEVVNNNNCATPRQNYSFDKSFIEFRAYHANLLLFYNCNDTSRMNYTTLRFFAVPIPKIKLCCTTP